MGGSSSTPRDLTVEEDAVGGTVKVSESVARRLIGKPDRPPKAGNPPPTTTNTSPQLKDEINNIQKNYEKRIEALEKQNTRLQQTTTEHFAKAVDEVEKKFIKTMKSKPVCEDLQDEVMKCYQSNNKESLNCAPMVKAYSTCVQQQRETILTKTDEDCQPCMLAQMARGPCGLNFMRAYDCYLEQGSEEECGLLYLEMKDCWDKHPKYGYQKIVDKAYSDIPSEKKRAVDDSKENTKTDNQMASKDVDSRKPL